MGVPKFFRYISERYPCLSEQLKEYQIPEFDNLYLDMNGIIHTCSHPNDADVQFRITEEDIFKNIFHYIEVLFRIIQPQKLFFMAVDGVAPRAKINQQRGRRFRSAKEAEVLEAKAKSSGVDLPKEARFDSNCITPGTLFMAKLSEQLKYFISYKISKDKLWQKCKVIFSGSEVPGEGEHKIMDYIRYMKSQPDYDSDTRHCLYGLDADLIMLGLCTHEPHFSLLREEVVFGKKQRRIATAEETNFCLLHLSLMREYLEHEFSPVKDKISFPFDIEKIIDDWVLIGFLVGNDFIPHLPNLHIAQGILPILYNAYMEVLPTLDGYINEAGTLNLDRFEKFMEKLSHLDMQSFEEVYADLKYFEGKTGRRPNETERFSYKASEDSPTNEGVPKSSNKALEALIKATDELTMASSEEDEDSAEDSDDTYNLEFVQHKRDYYMNKLDYNDVDEEVLRAQAEGYVRAIQWNLNYYYNGCCSWSWFYPHHYAPYISDIKDFKDLKLEFDMGVPFLPFQQLLAVLPAASKALLPTVYQSLLTEEESPIINYYPLDFKTDLNGKKQEWEAVVLIPFIDEKDLLGAMAPHNANLLNEEVDRNREGAMCIYTLSENETGMCDAPEYFPSFQSTAAVQFVRRNEIVVPVEKLVKGLYPDVKLSVYFPGFPTLQHIDHTAKLEKAKVKVFEQPSRGESMILTIVWKPIIDLYSIANKLLGKTVFVNWPHLLEAQVVSVSNEKCKLNFLSSSAKQGSEQFVKEELRGLQAQQWELQKKAIVEIYKTRMGVDVNDVEYLIHARPIIGRRYIFGTKNKLTLEKQWSENAQPYVYQAIIQELNVYDPHFVQYTSVNEIFVSKSICFMLGHPHYGAMGEVTDGVDLKTGRVKVAMKIAPEPDFDPVKKKDSKTRMQYMHGSMGAQRLGISSHLLSRITGTILVAEPNNDSGSKHNIGLNLKFNKRNEEIPGFTKKDNGQWLYSVKAIDLIRSYMQKCPELFEKLDRAVGSTDIFNREDLFTNTNQLEEIVAWLKEQQKLHYTESRACGRDSLEVEIIKFMEEEIDAYLQNTSNGKIVLMQVKPHLLYKPGLNDKMVQPDTAAVHRVFDRIIVVRENYTVPVGYKGTIIEVQKSDNARQNTFEILFDKSFVGGLTLHSCSPHRFYRLSATDFINISHGIRVEQGKSVKSVPEVQNWRAQQMQQKPQPPQPQKPQMQIQQQRHPQPRANSSAFASLGPSGVIFPGPPNHRMPVIGEPQLSSKLVSDFEAKMKAAPVNKTHAQFSKQKSRPGQATEFQALWNELHKAQAPTELRPCSTMQNSAAYKLPQGNPKPSPSQNMNPNPIQSLVSNMNPTTIQSLAPNMNPMLMQNVAPNMNPSPMQNLMPNFNPTPIQNPNPVQSNNQQQPQDPSAILKALLKIFDEPSQKSTPQTSKSSDAPPLVQQLFDRAREVEKKKETIWHCTQLLTHYQLNNGGFPRYIYSYNDTKTLVCAQIILPDMRVFYGDFCGTPSEAAESAAKKVYQELNLDKVPLPKMPVSAPAPVPPPQHWFNQSQGPNMGQNFPQPMKPPMPPSFPAAPNIPMSMPRPKWNVRPQLPQPVFSPPGLAAQDQIRRQRPPLNCEQNPVPVTKVDLKKSTPFVPLQAEKKNRKAVSKAPQNKLKSNKEQANKEPVKQMAPQTSKETSNREENQDSNVPQKFQRSVRRKKSRIAANFESESTLNGGSGAQQS